MARFQPGDKVKVTGIPVNWPSCSKFTLAGALATVATWVDWPEAMDPYDEFVYATVDETGEEGRAYEGAMLIFHEDTLAKIG